MRSSRWKARSTSRGKIKPVATSIPIDAEKPRSLVLDPPLTDAELEALCAASDWFRFERTREGEILMNPPAGGFTSGGNAEILTQLQLLVEDPSAGKGVRFQRRVLSSRRLDAEP